MRKKSLYNLIYLSLLCMILPALTGCTKQTDDTHRYDTTLPPADTRHTKMLYDLVRSYNSGAPALRDDISYTLPEALAELEVLYSYAYGDYEQICTHTYDMVDTVTLGIASDPIDGQAFTTLTNDILEICAGQVDRLNSPDEVYFYGINFDILSYSGHNASLRVHTTYGNTPVSVSVTPGTGWPYRGDLGGYWRDDKLCSHSTSNGVNQAPGRIAAAVNAARPYINPVIGISQGQQVVVINEIVLPGSASDFTPSHPSHYNNRWNTLMNGANPDDTTPNDCTQDLNCWKWRGTSGAYDDVSFDCNNSASNKCIPDTEAEHYYNRFMHSVLDCFSYYGRNYLTTYVRGVFFDGMNVCYSNELCYYWWENEIKIGTLMLMPTKPDDKVKIPEIIR